MSKAFLNPKFDQEDPERTRNRVRLLPDVVSNCF